MDTKSARLTCQTGSQEELRGRMPKRLPPNRLATSDDPKRSLDDVAKDGGLLSLTPVETIFSPEFLKDRGFFPRRRGNADCNRGERYDRNLRRSEASSGALPGLTPLRSEISTQRREGCKVWTQRGNPPSAEPGSSRHPGRMRFARWGADRNTATIVSQLPCSGLGFLPISFCKPPVPDPQLRPTFEGLRRILHASSGKTAAIQAFSPRGGRRCPKGG